MTLRHLLDMTDINEEKQIRCQITFGFNSRHLVQEPAALPFLNALWCTIPTEQARP